MNKPVTKIINGRNVQFVRLEANSGIECSGCGQSSAIGAMRVPLGPAEMHRTGNSHALVTLCRKCASAPGAAAKLARGMFDSLSRPRPGEHN